MNEIEKMYYDKMVELGTQLDHGEISREEHTEAVIATFKEFSTKYPSYEYTFSLIYVMHPFIPIAMCLTP